MAKILYSLAQEGRGHASRGYEIIRRLTEKGHSVFILTGGDSYEPLEEALKKNKQVTMTRIPGLKFTYDEKGRLNRMLTVSNNAKIVMHAMSTITQLEKLIEKHNFDLVISDFEPFVPRAAKSMGINFITIDNQHRFVFERPDKKVLLGRNAVSYLLTREIIRAYHPFGKKCIITSSFEPKIEKTIYAKRVKVYTVGPIIREEVVALKKKTTTGKFILVYVKKPLEQAIIPKLTLVDDDFVMYVKNPKLHKNANNTRITYKKHSGVEFAKDLARCKAVISSAGEQLMSEALYLGKPLFLLPEEGTYEQKLNADLVKNRKVGDAEDISKVEPSQIQTFLSQLPEYEKNINKMHIRNGIDEVMKIIFGELHKRK